MNNSDNPKLVKNGGQIKWKKNFVKSALVKDGNSVERKGVELWQNK